MSYTPRSSRAWLCPALPLFFIAAALPQGAYAFIDFGFSGMFEAILRPQTWEPTELIQRVQEQVVVEDDYDYSEAFWALFQEPEDPWSTLRDAIALHTQAAMDGDGTEAENFDLITGSLLQVIGLLYEFDGMGPVDVVDAEVIGELAEYVYGVELVGDGALPQDIARNLYQLWSLFLFYAVQSDSAAVRSRAYCELGFVLRLNVLSGEGGWDERIYGVLLPGLQVLDYPEYLTLVQAFAHNFLDGSSSEQVRILALMGLVTVAMSHGGQALGGEIRDVLVEADDAEQVMLRAHEKGLLSEKEHLFYNALFFHPERLFRFSLM